MFLSTALWRAASRLLRNKVYVDTNPCVTFLTQLETGLHKYSRRQTRLLARAHTLKNRIARTNLNK